ncbi:MAG: LPS-assembly protein LptD [Gemmatimonadota bacterium]
MSRAGRRSLAIAIGLLILGTPALAQDGAKKPPVGPRKKLPAARPQAAPSPLDTLPRLGRDTLPLETVPGRADTTPRIDIEARRAALTEDGFPQRDSTFSRLLAAPGASSLEYRGRAVTLEVARERIGLGGDAQVNYGSDVLTADTIRYLGSARFLSASGHITLVGADQKQVTSDSVLYYDVGGLKGTIYNAETTFSQRGADWRVFGDVIPVGQDTIFATAGSFTSCELGHPHYYFKAGRMKLVSRDVIVAWPVVLYVGHVPVFWLPFFAQDIRPGRHSGILPPRFGFNDIVRTSESLDRQVSDFGYYWAISPFMDAQATIDWFSGNYTRLNGSFRYRFLKEFIRGSLLYSHSFGSSGRNLSIDWSHDQELGLNTQLRVSSRFVQNTQLFQDRTFDPRSQTQTIDSDAGLTHRFSFADLSASVRRRQFLSVDDRTELTLPSLNVTFSPITLFPAPRNRQGAFQNLVWSGSGNFSRRTTNSELSPDVTSTTGGASSNFRLRSLALSSSGRFSQTTTTPLDSLGNELSDQVQSTITWTSSADYQLDLIGSTTLRPTIRAQGALFRSPDTGNDFVTAPTRYDFGATLSTDLFGFYPGFGPFTRIRHKFSPGFTWSYSPPITVDSAFVGIPGFPTTSGDARNLLTVTLRQTFEAKVRAESGAGTAPGRDVRFAADSATAGPAQARAQGVGGAAGGARRRAPERTVTLLAINTSPLQFDFERAKKGEPVLLTERLTNSITSDLFRGLNLNMEHDLFEGSGPNRKFKPFLSRLAASVSIRSGTGLRDLVGLGARQSRPGPSFTDTQRLDSRYRLREFGAEPDAFGREEGAGPWDLTLRYSLLRVRPGEVGRASQTIDGNLSFHPTPKWAVRWTTQYNFTEGEFGQHLVTLDRDLHRWRASFQFARSPNGNVLFQVLLNLRDAPELKLDYDQRSEPPRR